jgi:hypothetical protein
MLDFNKQKKRKRFLGFFVWWLMGEIDVKYFLGIMESRYFLIGPIFYVVRDRYEA